MLILTESDLRAVLTMREVIQAVEGGFRSLAAGDCRVPQRLQLDIEDSGAVLLEMPAYVRGQQTALGTKIVSVFPENAARALDIVQAAYLLLDSETGEPLALMEGRFITAIRTAATSAVATHHMTHPGPKRVALIGTGVQAQFHLAAMMEAANVESVTIASRSSEKAARLAECAQSQYGITCEAATASEAAIRANLICTCTASPVPLFDGKLLSPGTHINAVGAFTPTTRELDSETVRRARVIIDDHSAAGREAGELLIPIQEGTITRSYIAGTLADVVSGRIAGRESPEEITLFKSCGLAIEDLVTARLAYQRAAQCGVGAHVSL
jgi:ornithine cyclodeaminase/alanine dehydrogenase